MSPEKIAAQFGRNLAEARSWAGLTQAQLANQVAIGHVDIARFETGVRCPRLDRVVELADAVGVQVRDLLWEIE